jgi:hypothetical protein
MSANIRTGAMRLWIVVSGVMGRLRRLVVKYTFGASIQNSCWASAYARRSEEIWTDDGQANDWVFGLPRPGEPNDDECSTMGEYPQRLRLAYQDAASQYVQIFGRALSARHPLGEAPHPLRRRGPPFYQPHALTRETRAHRRRQFSQAPKPSQMPLRQTLSRGCRSAPSPPRRKRTPTGALIWLDVRVVDRRELQRRDSAAGGGRTRAAERALAQASVRLSIPYLGVRDKLDSARLG